MARTPIMVSTHQCLQVVFLRRPTSFGTNASLRKSGTNRSRAHRINLSPVPLNHRAFAAPRAPPVVVAAAGTAAYDAAYGVRERPNHCQNEQEGSEAGKYEDLQHRDDADTGEARRDDSRRAP